MSINCKRKGSRNELKAMHQLEAVGYTVTKAGGSLGMWDLIAMLPGGHTRCVQVKTNRRPLSAELESMQQWTPPAHCTKELWVYRDGSSTPAIEVLK